MWADFPIYSTKKFFILKFAPTPPVSGYEIMAITDGDKGSHKVYAIELFLYHEPSLSVEAIAAQFRGVENVWVEEENGLMSMRLRKEPIPQPGWGFGRAGHVGVDKAGRLSILLIEWNAPGAGTPYVDRVKALADLPHREGSPTWG